MPQQLKYIAQLAMDSFYQSYKTQDDFWEIEDFISLMGNTIAGMYLAIYQQDFAMLRQEKKDEVVSFDSGWLLEQEIDVKKEGRNLIGYLDAPVMTFPYDRSSIGIQNVFITEPFSDNETERVTLSSLWQLKHLPKVDKVFFCTDLSSTKDCDKAGLGKIIFVNKGDCNIKKARVLYVPTMNDGNAWVADGIISDAITKTVLSMKQIEQGTIVDSTNNGNENKIIQSEIDKNTLVK